MVEVFMKYLKKIMAVVLVFAITYATISPAAVRAEMQPIPLCGHDMSMEVLIDEYWCESEVTEHSFEFPFYEGGKWIENGTAYCTVIVVHQVYKQSCACGKYERYREGIEEVHCEPDCPGY